MSGHLRPLVVLMLAAFMITAGNGPLTTILSLRLEAAAAPAPVIGAVSAAYFAGLTLGSLFAYKLILGVGHIRALVAFASVMSATALLYPIHLNYGLWGGLRLAEGFCMAGLFVCIESWLNDLATPASRGKILAAYMTCLYVGQGSGQFLLNLPDSSGFVLFILFSILLSFAVVPVALTPMAAPSLPDIVSLGLRRLFAASPLGIVGTVASGLVLGSFYSLGPVFARGTGLDIAGAALFMSAAIFGGVLLQWPVGWLSDWFDRRKVIIGVLAGLAAVGLAMTAAGGGWALLAAAALFGGAAFVLYPLSVAHTNDHLGPRDRVGASGGLVLGYSIGATIGPLAASGTMGALGPDGLFLFVAAVAGASCLYGLWRMRVAAPVPSELQEPYQALPRTTPVAAPLDPRVDAEAAERA